MRRDVFQAIADPVRRDIIEMLVEEPQTVNQIAERFQISRPAISKHLKILNECGVVTTQQLGRERYCAIEPMNLLPAYQWLEKYKQQWEERLDSFENYLEELKNNKKP